MEYKFDLNPDQIKKLNIWEEKIKRKYKEYGTFTYSFTPCGIGIGIEVYSHLSKKKLDLSDVEHW